jgi:hypothetical protein
VQGKLQINLVTLKRKISFSKTFTLFENLYLSSIFKRSSLYPILVGARLSLFCYIHAEVANQKSKFLGFRSYGLIFGAVSKG